MAFILDLAPVNCYNFLKFSHHFQGGLYSVRSNKLWWCGDLSRKDLVTL